jgi:energy-coupling factor transport system permease protein
VASETALSAGQPRTRPAVRPAHPWAWWGWALGIAGAASLGTNPLLNALIALAIAAVALLRRTDDPWARSIGAYFVLAGFVLAIRLFFAIVAGAGAGTTVLFTLPQVALPDWAAGIRLGGPVTAEPLAYTAYDSLRLGLILLCLGAANALANPKRALKSVPAALYEASVAVVIALSVAPQLVESTQRIRRAQRLRGGDGTGWRSVTRVVVPVLADAIDRSMSLAAGMEARGFGRTRAPQRQPPAVTAGLIGAMMLATFGGFLLLAGDTPQARGAAALCLVAGCAGIVVGLRLSGRRLAVTRYRPDPWTLRDTGLVVAGLVALGAAAVLASTAWPEGYAVMHPSTDPLTWPTLHPAMAPILLGALAPLALTAAPDGGRP